MQWLNKISLFYSHFVGQASLFLPCSYTGRSMWPLTLPEAAGKESDLEGLMDSLEGRPEADWHPPSTYHSPHGHTHCGGTRKCSHLSRKQQCHGESMIQSSPTQLFNPFIHSVWGRHLVCAGHHVKCWSHKDHSVLKKFSK